MTHYDPEDYLVTTITIAEPIGPTNTGEPNIVTITTDANSTSSETAEIPASDEEIGTLIRAAFNLWGRDINPVCGSRNCTADHNEHLTQGGQSPIPGRNTQV